MNNPLITDEMGKKRFTMTLSYLEGVACLTAEQAFALLMTIRLYLRTGRAEGEGAALPLFRMAKDEIDAEAEEQARRTEKESEKETDKEKVTQKETDKEKEKEKAVANRARERNFIKPTVEEVRSYADGLGYKGFDAERFWNFYESKGWVVGRATMRSWHSAVANWHKGDMERLQRFGGSARPRTAREMYLETLKVCENPEDYDKALEEVEKLQAKL